MHPQLETLLEIQDLEEQKRTLTEAAAEHREVEEEQFNVDPEEATAHLDEAIADLYEGLPQEIRGRYDRVSSGRGRAVVPVINGTCYGCFVSIPTAVASDRDPNDEVRHCGHCGRFVYVLS